MTSAQKVESLHKKSDVPYDAVDIEVRRLVWLMNQWPGIQTLSSCAGHVWPSPEAGISFVADTQERLAGLIAALPPLGWRGGFVANQSQWEALTLSVQNCGDGISYSLNIDGYPQHVQRALIGKVEKALESATGCRPHNATTEPLYIECCSRLKERLALPLNFNSMQEFF